MKPYNKYDEQRQRVPPVSEGELLFQKPTGAKRDPFINYHGFIIFIKNVPQEKWESIIPIKIVRVMPNYGIAEFVQEVT